MAADGSEPSFVAPCAFSPKTRRYLAVCARDRTLRIWDTSQNRVQQEHPLSAQPGAVCTCISWAPSRTVKQDRPQRKRKKLETGKVADKEDLLALGTTAGCVVIYSVAEGQLHSTLNEGHSGAVNCVRWHPEGHFLYSVSDDTHIIEWDLLTGGVHCKWKADRGPVTRLCVSPDGQWLLSAGQTIKMWNLESKEIYRRFKGHCAAVSTLCFITAHMPESDSLYFLSGAAGDPLLSVWQVQSDRNDKSAALSFALTDEPHHIDITDCDNKDQVLRMAVVCKDGQLHMFQHHLNGPCKKPLSPTCSVQVLSAGAQQPTAGDAPVPLLAAVFSTEKEMLLAYGSYLQPLVERVVLNTAERHVRLVRNFQATLMVTADSAVSKVTTTDVSVCGKMLSSCIQSQHTPLKTVCPETRKKKLDPGAEQMTKSTLGKMREGETLAGKGGPERAPSLQTDSFTTLLVQGLESGDKSLLNKVLQISKEGLIKKTVARLPGPAIMPLVVELTKRIQGHPYCAVLMVRWLKAVLIQHASYLSTLPDVSSSLGLLRLLIESRMKMFHKLTRLHGKLYLLITQVAACDSIGRVTEPGQGARIVYEEESSDEDETSGDEGLPEEVSDNWEDDEENEDGMEETLDKETQEGIQLKEDPKGSSDSDFHQDNESDEE